MKSPLLEKCWYGKDWNKSNSGYSSNPDKAKAYGIEISLYNSGTILWSNQSSWSSLTLAVRPPLAISRISDREVSFGDGQATFSPNEKFNVVNPRPLLLDLTPPLFTAKFDCTVTF